MQPAVSGLEQEFPGQVVAANVDATTEDAQQIVAGLGFQNHGLVVRSGDGEVRWKQADHKVDMSQVRTALTELLE